MPVIAMLVSLLLDATDTPDDTARPERTVERFAWFPTRLTGGGWIHLCHYESTERWEPDEASGWSTGCWLTVHRRLPLSRR